MNELFIAIIDWLNATFGDKTWLGDIYFQVGWLLLTFALLKFAGRCHPTRQAFLILSVPILIFALGTGANQSLHWLSWVFNPVFCLFLLIDRFLLAPNNALITVHRMHSATFPMQSPSPVALQIINNSQHPISGEVIDAFPNVCELSGSNKLAFKTAPYESSLLQYDLIGKRRGPAQFGKTFLRYKSPLGLLWLNAQLGEASPVDIYPDLRTIRELRLKYTKAFALGELQKRKLGAEGTQFDSLRNYVPGDDIRKMAWQATARMDLPVVRMYTHEVEQPIVILIDAGRKMLGSPKELDIATESIQPSKFDYALNAALAFASIALERGDDVEASVFHQKTIARVPFGRGEKQFQRLLKALAHVQAEAIEPDYESIALETARKLTKRSLIVLFTDLIDPLTSKSLTHSLTTLAKHHIVVIATWKDEALLRQAQQIPTDLEASYQQGVRLDLLEIRSRTLRELSNHGNISVVDATPETLNEQMIEHYVNLKLKNRI